MNHAPGRNHGFNHGFFLANSYGWLVCLVIDRYQPLLSPLNPLVYLYSCLLLLVIKRYQTWLIHQTCLTINNYSPWWNNEQHDCSMGQPRSTITNPSLNRTIDQHSHTITTTSWPISIVDRHRIWRSSTRLAMPALGQSATSCSDAMDGEQDPTIHGHSWQWRRSVPSPAFPHHRPVASEEELEDSEFIETLGNSHWMDCASTSMVKYSGAWWG